jgi:large subunit ribosomal protein L30
MVNLDKLKTMKRIRITQVRSGIGQTLRQKRTLEALGLKKMHYTVELDATPQILGMCKKVEHLVKVEEV